jgi:hypothetical protein
MLDWELFLDKNFPNGKKIYYPNKIELNIDCINEDCPNPKNHMFVNIYSNSPKHDKRFHCHRCSINGDYKTFLSIFYGVPYMQINKQYLDYFQDMSLDRMRKELQKASTNLDLNDKDIFKQQSFNIDLPPSKVLISHTRWTKKRDFSIHALTELGARICTEGFYKDRIIFPLFTMNNSSFLAYSQSSKKDIITAKLLSKKFPDNKTYKLASLKVLYPAKSMISSLVFNYNRVKSLKYKDRKTIVIVEGMTDVIRSIMHGIEALGIGKTSISTYQAALIGEIKTNSIIYIPDSDVKQNVIENNVNTLKQFCECDVSYRKLLKGDVDDIRDTDKYLELIRGSTIKGNNLRLIK